MRKANQNEGKSKRDRLQTILRLIEQYPINRQEELLKYLRQEGFEVTQATVSRDMRELCLVKSSAENGSYRYIAGQSDKAHGAKNISRFEMIFRESVLRVDYAGHIVLVKCYSGMANAACEVFDAMNWPAVVGTLSGDDTFFILTRTEHDAKAVCSELARYAAGERDNG